MERISSRLTERLGIAHPIISAPMAFAAGGALAAAVSRAGGLGLIGGGYGDDTWLEDQFLLAGGAPVGVGFITWSLRKSPVLLTTTLRHRPRAVMLSFGDPRPFVDEIRAAGAALICQCQNLDHVWDAIDVGADVIVAQGAEAGGHGSARGTMTFVPEAADLIREQEAPSVLVAAGGIADGRGLAAALMLGAEGVLVGTRFWATQEALVPPRHHDAILAAGGDATVRTQVVDIARQLPWPVGFSARVLRNAFVERWHGREDELRRHVDSVGPRYREAFNAGDPDETGVWFGETAGLIGEIKSAGAIVEEMAAQAAELLDRWGAKPS